MSELGGLCRTQLPQGISAFRNSRKPHRRGRLLIDLNLRTAVKDNLEDLDLCEYMVAVDWIKTVDRSVKHWKKNAGLFAQRGTTQASLVNQRATIDFVERCFEVNIEQLANVTSGNHF